MRNKVKFWLLITIACTAGVTGCKKSSKGSAPAWTPGSDIYIVGVDSSQAVYWKNGVKTVLGTGEGEGITVNGTSVYVGGMSFKGGPRSTEVAAYWEDGMEHDMTDTGVAYGYQPVVVGSDVYVPGYVFGPAPQVYPVYWKNGQRITLDPSTQGIATGMAIQGTDIYVIGSVFDGQFDTCLVWKNGLRLTNFYSIETNPFNQILASGENIYVVGQQGYYVNFTQFNQLPGASQGISTIAMSIAGSDVYVGGASDSGSSRYAAYWKNGVRVALANYPGTTSSAVSAVVVAGSDVYACGGAIVNGAYFGLYWKNGIESTLTKVGTVYGATLGN